MGIAAVVAGSRSFQVAVDEKSSEVPAVREVLKAFADSVGAVLTFPCLAC